MVWKAQHLTVGQVLSTCAQFEMEGTQPNCKQITLTCAQLGLKGTQPNCTYPDGTPYPPPGAWNVITINTFRSLLQQHLQI